MAWENRDYYKDRGGEGGMFGGGGGGMGGWPLPPKGTLGVVVACVVMFILQGVTGDLSGRGGARGAGGAWGFMTEWGGLGFRDGWMLPQVWRWVTYQYLHGDAFHIFFNVLTIIFFMPSLERRWGTQKTLVFYTLGGIAAGVLYAAVYFTLGSQSTLIGASGSALAVLGACALLFPEKQVIVLVFPVPIRVLALLLGLFYLLTTVGSGNLSDAAHLGGLVFGVLAPMSGAPMLERWLEKRAERKRVSEIREQQREQEEVDRILEKVHQKGMHSLTGGEKRTLKRATERQKKQEAARKQVVAKWR